MGEVRPQIEVRSVLTKKQTWRLVAVYAILLLGACLAGMLFVRLASKVPELLIARIGGEVETLRAKLPVGLSRAEAYARIKADNKVAYAADYPIVRRDPKNPDISLETERFWPPEMITISDADGKVLRRVSHPRVRVDYWMGTSLSCSASVDLIVEFDRRDLVKRTVVTPLQWTCM